MGWKWKLAQKLEFEWWQRYLKNKNAVDYLSWKKGYWLDILDKISSYLPVLSDKQILDAGCGPAGIFMALEGNRVDAIDPLLDKYSSLIHFQPQASPWTQFRSLSIEQLEEREKYDVIFCMNAINHVRDIELCYDKLEASLKPNGCMVISTDAHRYGLLKKIFQLLPGDMLHPVQLDIREYEAFLTNRNLAIVQTVLLKREPIFDYHITIARK